MSGASTHARRPSAVAIGNFDGVHVGHRMLVERAIVAARERGARSVVLTFDRHPATVVRPESAPKLLTSVARKLELLRASGVDEVVVLRFDEERAAETAEDFVASVLVGALAARAVVVGASFRFGNRQRGDVALLEQMGGELGFSVERLDLVDVEAGDGTLPVSSSRIRLLLGDGRVEEAARLLGRPHEVEVEAVAGGGSAVETGAELLVPGELLLPRPGRYAVGIAPAGATATPDAVRAVVRVPAERPSTVVVESTADGEPRAPGAGERVVVGFLAVLEESGPGASSDDSSRRRVGGGDVPDR